MKVAGPQKTIARARVLRRELSLPEVMLWQRLRGSPGGVRFRRQHPAGPYILDFFCATANLVIEIDGIAHSMANADTHDARRDSYLASQGLKVWRIPAREVLGDADDVAASIIAAAQAADPLRRYAPPPPEEGGGALRLPHGGDGNTP